MTTVDEDNETAVSLHDLAAAVATGYDADVFYYSGGINDDGFARITEAVLSAKTSSKALLILVTNGGSANSAYKIARFFQKVYEDLAIYAPRNCYSAGTIVALGAHRLILGPFSELGPLDVQLLKPNELGARKSGLLTRSAFSALQDTSFELFESFMLRIMAKSGGLISFRVAAEVSATLAGELLSGVFQKIDPDVVGSDQRDLEVALQYGIRLADVSKNADLATIYHLVHNYPAHDFIIDADEASELFENVEFPSQELMMLSAVLPHEFPGGEDLVVVSLRFSAAEDASNDPKPGDFVEAEDEAETPAPRRMGRRRRSNGAIDSGSREAGQEDVAHTGSGAEPGDGQATSDQ